MRPTWRVVDRSPRRAASLRLLELAQLQQFNEVRPGRWASSRELARLVLADLATAQALAAGALAGEFAPQELRLLGWEQLCSP